MSELSKIQDLLKMDMGECIEWLIDNQYDFNITPINKTGQAAELKKSVFENMDALLKNAPEYCSEDSLEILHDMHESTEFLFELYKDESVKYIEEWKKLNLKQKR